MNFKQQLFIKEYLIDKNGTQAAMRAGYSKAGARVAASRLLTNRDIIEEIERELSKELKRAEKRAMKFNLTKERWIKELQAIAFADMDDFVTITQGGIDLIETDQRKKGKGRVIKKMSQTVSQFGGSTSLELHSKIDALQLIGKHFGWLNDKGIVEEVDRPLAGLSDEELDKL